MWLAPSTDAELSLVGMIASLDVRSNYLIPCFVVCYGWIIEN
jgi:hypothetical protein